MQFLVEVDKPDVQSVMAALAAGGITVDHTVDSGHLSNGHALFRCTGDFETAVGTPGVVSVYEDIQFESFDPLSGCTDEYVDPNGPLEGCEEPGDPDD